MSNEPDNLIKISLHNVSGTLILSRNKFLFVRELQPTNCQPIDSVLLAKKQRAYFTSHCVKNRIYKRCKECADNTCETWILKRQINHNDLEQIKKHLPNKRGVLRGR